MPHISISRTHLQFPCTSLRVFLNFPPFLLPRLIMHPTTTRMTVKMALICVALIALFAICIASPIAVFSKLVLRHHHQIYHNHYLYNPSPLLPSITPTLTTHITTDHRPTIHRYVIIDDALIGLHRRYCVEQWPSSRQRSVYSVVTLCLQFVLPLCLIVALYARLLLRLRCRQRAKSADKKSKIRSRTAKTTIMLISVGGGVRTWRMLLRINAYLSI